MRDLIVVLIVLGAVPFILAKPYVGILVWSWLGYMNPHKLAWGWARQFPVAEVAAIATLIAMVFSREEKHFPFNRVTLLWLGLISVFTLTCLTAIYPDDAWHQWDKVAKIQLIAILTVVLITNRARLNQLIWVIVLSLGYFGFKGGLYVLRTGGASGRVWGPPGGFIEDNNALAVALLMTLPLMFFLRRWEKRTWVKRGLLVVSGLTVVSVLGSFSRGAFLGLIACGAFLWLKSSRRFPVAIAVAVGVVAALFIMPESWWSRMGTIQSHGDTSAQGRLDAWRLAITLASSRPLGGGFECWTADVYKTYGAEFMKPQVAHSIYFQVLGEHGWIALAMFLILFVVTWRMGSSAIRSAEADAGLDWECDLIRMIQVSLVAYAVGGAFLSLAYFDLPYHLIAMIVILDQYIRRRNTSPAKSGRSL